MARVLSTAFLVALLAATAAAFALTEGAKLELSPIYKTKVTRVFSPGITNANIDFRLRKTDRLTVWVTRDGKRVATIVPGTTYRPGPVNLVFTGVSPSGITLPEGVYVPVVHFGRSHRTITIPSKMRLDVTPPAIKVRHRIYTHISPDGDKRRDVFRVAYVLDGPAHAILLVDGRQVVKTLRQKLTGVLEWNGKLDGKPVPPGNYTLEATAEDEARNRAKPYPFAIVTVRYVVLGRTRVLARPGTDFAIRVLTDAPVVTWLLGGRHGESRSHTLHLRAPRKPGVYRLFVGASGHAAKAIVVVG